MTVVVRRVRENVTLYPNCALDDDRVVQIRFNDEVVDALINAKDRTNDRGRDDVTPSGSRGARSPFGGLGHR